MNPTRLYKYRSIKGITEGSGLSKDRAISNLINSKAVFSSRKNFNDIFDSKINYIRPSTKEICKLYLSNYGSQYSHIILEWISQQGITSAGHKFFSTLENTINTIFDTYPIYSVSAIANGNLMWAHYAGSHTGFCIEFNFPPELNFDRVVYSKTIATARIIDYMHAYLSGTNDASLGQRIHDALLIKLKYWEYENEYRWIAGNEMGKVPEGEKYILFDYPKEWVSGIIFGCRMPSFIKRYIVDTLPYKTNFMQAVERVDSIDIEPYSGQ